MTGLLKQMNKKPLNEADYKEQVDTMLSMNEDEIKKHFSKCKASIQQGNLTNS